MLKVYLLEIVAHGDAATPTCSRSFESDTDCDEKAAIYRGDLQGCLSNMNG